MQWHHGQGNDCPVGEYQLKSFFSRLLVTLVLLTDIILNFILCCIATRVAYICRCEKYSKAVTLVFVWSHWMIWRVGDVLCLIFSDRENGENRLGEEVAILIVILVLWTIQKLIHSPLFWHKEVDYSFNSNLSSTNCCTLNNLNFCKYSALLKENGEIIAVEQMTSGKKHI